MTIAKSVFTSAIDIMNIKSNFEGMEKEYRWYKNSYIKLPDVTGMTKKDVIKLLEEFKVKYSGFGDVLLFMWT